MKKVLVITCVAALLLAVASMAMASEVQWLLACRASNAEYNLGSAAASVGTMPSAKVTGWSDSAQGSAGLALWSGAYPGANNYAVMDARVPLTGDNSYTWEYRMWVNPQWSWTQSPLVLSFWNLSAMDVPETINGVEYAYTITMLQDPTGTFAAGTEWSFDATKNGTSTAPALIIPFSNAEGARMTAAEAVEGGIQFRVTAAPAAPVPEPGSMLALASGLVGMAGFAIRRRRA